MKKIYLIFSFISIFIGSEAQFSVSIEAIRNKFRELSMEGDRIFQPYDSVINLRNDLKIRLNAGLLAYSQCETAFRDKSTELIMCDVPAFDGIRNYRDLELKKEQLENEMVFTVFYFNHWNSKQSGKVRNYYNSYVLPGKMKMHSLNSELVKYIDKINELQAEAEAFFKEYDNCRKKGDTGKACRDLYQRYNRNISLIEKYMGHYSSILDEHRKTLKIKQQKYENYRNIYDRYYSNYQRNRVRMEEKIEFIEQEFTWTEASLSDLRPEIYDLISLEMEKDYREANFSVIREINRLDGIIRDEFGSEDFYDQLKEMQRFADIMVTTLNPEMDFIPVLDRIAGYDQGMGSIKNDAKKLRELSLKYGDILDDLKTAIRTFDAIPYYCLNAYPQYHSDIVEENLDIIDHKLHFTDESLEVRTIEFLNVSELDLSDTNFTLDLIFKGHNKIEKLNLSNTPVSSVKYLSDTGIEWLDLSNTGISREDLEDIRKMENIKYLDLSNTGLKKKDIFEVCFHLKVKRRNCKSGN